MWASVPEAAPGCLRRSNAGSASCTAFTRCIVDAMRIPNAPHVQYPVLDRLTLRHEKRGIHDAAFRLKRPAHSNDVVLELPIAPHDLDS